MNIPKNPPAPVGLCEIRNLELRDASPADDGVERFTFEGHAAVFDSLSDNLGGFREVIKRGAFKDVLTDDVRMLLNHDANYPLARGDNLELTEDPTGLKVKATIRSDLSYARDLRVNLEEGTITQMSFAFGSGVEDEWDEDQDGRLIRTIKRFKSLFDVSPVTFPAYPETDAGLRAINMLARGGSVTDEEWAAVLALRSTDHRSDGDTGGATVLEPASADTETDEPDQVDDGENGAGLSVVAAGRRIELLELFAQL